ncbi:CDP-glycerol glycerophosphotransferase family protein [Lonepinella sp. BR2474]|uniref:CDP-glycerol glycerophosphotransferase family protein n=1 Tax=Lonepinella sp. BR2474 TaxID=3434548 RepID=UPI003F6E1BBE
MRRILKLCIYTVIAIFGWILYTLSWVFPRNSNKIVFGTHTGNFTGNVKDLFIDHNFYDGAEKIFIYRNNSIKSKLDKLGGDYSYYPLLSVKGIFHSLTAGTFVYSSYVSDISFWLSNGAKLFNVWHGTPLKKIERDVNTGFYSIRNKYEYVFKYIYPHLYVKPSKLLVSSEYEKACFRTAFDIKNEHVFMESFPPRLGHLRNIYQHENCSGKSIILYAPTWRDDTSYSFYRFCDLDKLNNILKSINNILIIKPHPSDKSQHIRGEYSNIKLADVNEDFYTLVEFARLVVTDYSSVMFDCFYCDIPVILFCPDLDHYLRNSREFYVDIEKLPFVLINDDSEFIDYLECGEFNNYKNDKFKPYDFYMD